jgi:hypothetical protein
MAEYLVNHRYRSGTFGGWDKGMVVDLSVAEAEWVNNDSTGCLTLVEPAPEHAPEPESEPEVAVAEQDPADDIEPDPEPSKRAAAPNKDRMVRGGQNRSAK